MKHFGLLIVLVVMVSACAVPNSASPTATLPAFSPVALAQTTNAPTPTLDPRFTLTPSPTTAPSATPFPATQAAVPTQPAQMLYPSVVGEISLFDIPGEGRAPDALALLGDTAYAANRETENLAVIQNARVTKFIALEKAPTAITADSARNRIYAGTAETPTLYVIENEKITKQFAVQGPINALVVSGDVLYVALDNDPIIERYDAGTLTKRDEIKLSQGFAVYALQVDAAHNRLYASSYGKIVALDLEKFQELFTLSVPYLTATFALNPKDGSIWSSAYDETNSREYLVGFALDGKEIARMPLGSDLTAVTFDDADNLYALDRYENKLYVVHTPDTQLAATIALNETPSGAVFDHQHSQVFVANSYSDNVSVIDAAALRVVNTIPLAPLVTALVSNPQRNRVYAASGSTNAVIVVENDTVIGQIAVGNHPADIARDAATNLLYVVSEADGVMTVIDEATLEIRASKFITRALSTTAIDSENKKLFAGNLVLDPETLEPQATVMAKGLTLDSLTMPRFERANPALRKLYAIASNGVPGSNARMTLFRFLYDALDDSKMLGSRNNGNTSAFAIDPTTNNVFATSTHPLAYTHGLDVFDAQDNLVQSLALNSRTFDVEINPETHHVFLSHALTYAPPGRALPPQDDTVQILDTRTLGQVMTVPVPNAPQYMTRSGKNIYVSSLRDGALTIIQDNPTQKPPAPTPTLTPTPFPTWTPAPDMPATPTAASGMIVTCSFGPPVPFAELWLKYTNELGCPTDVAAEGNFAIQTFKNGVMYDDVREEYAKKIYVLFPDHTYEVYPDFFREGGKDAICPEKKLSGGLMHPIRGFGTLWCNSPELQSKMPGAVAPEKGISLKVQDFEHGMMWANTPQGVITFFENGTWR